jgi:8-amino-7-oxononanoate synthase
MANNESPLLERIARELRERREKGLLRTLELPRGISLFSNDYLALSSHPRLREETIRAIQESGRVGSGGSRLLGGNSADWERMEAEFAAFAGTEAAIYFSSGYAANVGLLSAVARPCDIVFSDSLNHASLIDGIRLSGARKIIYPHGDMARLEEVLERHGDERGAKFIVTESLFSMEGDFAPLGELAELARRHGAELIVDEAHAVGVFGPGGRGLAAEAAIEKQALAVVHTCGKALGSAGAFVCSHRILKEYLVNRARTFVFSTAAPPYLAHQIGAAVRLARGMDAERARLAELARTLREGLRGEGFSVGEGVSQIVPVMTGTNDRALAWAETLQEAGFAVRAIRPPTVPEGTARLRFSLTVALAPDQIEHLVEACVNARRRTNLASARSLAGLT